MDHRVTTILEEGLHQDSVEQMVVDFILIVVVAFLEAPEVVGEVPLQHLWPLELPFLCRFGSLCWRCSVVTNPFIIPVFVLAICFECFVLCKYIV
jgi:hypothetical protein